MNTPNTKYASDIHRKESRMKKFLLLGIVFWMLFILPSCSTNGDSLQAQEISSDEEMLELFHDIYAKIIDEYVDEQLPQELIYAALRGMISSLNDPYSRFLDNEELSDLQMSTSGVFGGLGMHVNKHRSDNEEERHLEVISPIEGTPAFFAGMRSGDLIIDVEGEPTNVMSTLEAVMLLRGEPGSTVTITVKRGSGNPFEVSLTRELITVPAIRAGIIEDDIAYIKLILFSEHTAVAFKEFFEKEYQADTHKGLIIDLRGNGGGLLSAANKMVDYFFDDGTIVSLRGRNRENETVYTASKSQLIPDEIPIVVLIDNATASASEILAGALKDRERAIIIGTTSYGKGSVQEVLLFGEEGIRLTTARYYTPSGASIDEVGIPPDIEISDPLISEEEDEVLIQLLESGIITAFAQNNSNATQAEQDAFIVDIAEEYTPLNEWYARRFLRSELFRTSENKLLPFDARYDAALNEAIEYLRSN